MKNFEQPASPMSANDGAGNNYYTDGLTKLEYFSATAMQGILGSAKGDDWMSSKNVAKKSVEYATSLLAELDKVRNELDITITLGKAPE